jgi:hypothetical protein
VLWIGWLQWHVRTRGLASVAEPVVHDYGNIEHRDAVLAYDRSELATDDSGQVITRWDGVTFKRHPVTGEDVPDEAAQVPQWKYINPRPAEWPAADFIVGNPPFIGAKYLRDALGDGYAQTLRATWPDVPESADFVMYWWHHAACLVRAGLARRFGFITTNSLRQTFNRRVVQAALDGAPVAAGLVQASGVAGAGHAGGLMLPNAQKSAPGTPRPGLQALSLVYAIPDHPWVDSANGAAVRIAMTVAKSGSDPDFAQQNSGSDPNLAGHGKGRLLTVTDEQTAESGEVIVSLVERQGRIQADLKVGAAVSGAGRLKANADLSSPGVKLHGAGFIVSREEAAALGLGTVPGLERHVREYRNGRDLMASPRDALVIDLFGLNADEVRGRFPAVFQWVTERVKPERDHNNRATYRDNWWLFGEPRKEFRPAITGLGRFIATVVTAKHRLFQFLKVETLPDDALIAVALEDGLWLGVMSSEVHVLWALRTGSTLEDRPRYIKTLCFEAFPFPSDDTGLTPELTDRIRHLAEQLDAHRKARQAAFESVTLTGLYNVLDKLRRGEALSPKEKDLHEQGLVSVLRSLHDELDAAVLAAYGWSDLGPVPWADEAARAVWTEVVLERLVALNARRAAEEAAGTIRWLRPDFQDPARRAEREAAAAQAARDPAEGLLNQERLATIPRWEQPDLGMKMAENEAPPASQAPEVPAEDATAHPAAPAPATAAQPWPATLPEQVRAVAQLLAASPAPLPLPAIEAGFKGKGPWKKGLPRILDTLEALGRARREGAGWRG